MWPSPISSNSAKGRIAPTQSGGAGSAGRSSGDGCAKGRPSFRKSWEASIRTRVLRQLLRQRDVGVPLPQCDSGVRLTSRELRSIGWRVRQPAPRAVHHTASAERELRQPTKMRKCTTGPNPTWRGNWLMRSALCSASVTASSFTPPSDQARRTPRSIRCCKPWRTKAGPYLPSS